MQKISQLICLIVLLVLVVTSCIARNAVKRQNDDCLHPTNNNTACVRAYDHELCANITINTTICPIGADCLTAKG